MDLIHATDSGWVSVLGHYSIDMAFGDPDENDFELEVPLAFAKEVDGSMIEKGDLVFFPGTEWGGVVDGIQLDDTGDYPVMRYAGRTWHGVMSHSVLRPDSGDDYLTVSGTVEDVMASIIHRQGLDGVFEAVGDSGASVSSYSFDRYTDMYSGLQKMLGTVGMRLSISKGRGLCEVSAEPVRDISDGVDDNLLRLKMGDSRPVNHLVCLGSGELAARIVVDLYMDLEGDVSRTQTLFGANCIEEVYDSTNADEAELVEKGTERLLGYYEDSRTISGDIGEAMTASIGDTVTGRSVNAPVRVTAPIVSINVVASNGGEPELSYKIGTLRVI